MFILKVWFFYFCYLIKSRTFCPVRQCCVFDLVENKVNKYKDAGVGPFKNVCFK